MRAGQGIESLARASKTRIVEIFKGEPGIISF